MTASDMTGSGGARSMVNTETSYGMRRSRWSIARMAPWRHAMVVHPRLVFSAAVVPVLKAFCPFAIPEIGIFESALRSVAGRPSGGGHC